MFNPLEIFHPLILNESSEPPEKFTYPFQYIPHPWVLQAADELKSYLKNQNDFEYQFGWDEQSTGKMFGVLIVENQKKELGYLTAFSGKINEFNQLSGFVPPIFDVLNPNGFFKIGENELNQMNLVISELEKSTNYHNLEKKYLRSLEIYESELKTIKQKHKLAKKKRDLLREELALRQNESEMTQVLDSLIRESKLHHFELKDFKKASQIEIQKAKDEFLDFQRRIDDLKNLRKTKSAHLQNKLHASFRIKNAFQETATLISIFDLHESLPPAGAGECAAPRLLQYAFENNLKPICMGEFWWGKEPNSAIRKHGEFYPACKSKCKPILEFMLKGLTVEKNPISPKTEFSLDILYEDKYLMVINKPDGVLSVPGKKIKDSLWLKVKEYLPSDFNPIMVHRLDMSTSGLILVAKNLDVYRELQAQFSHRKVKKTYTAILDGIPKQSRGEISFPIRPNLDHRPRQMHCSEHGKPARTYYHVIEEATNKSKVLFYPETGRTHQLRVHAAHQKGLGIPILGDDLYGKSKDRLYLHASGLEFIHPVLSKTMKFVHKPDFDL